MDFLKANWQAPSYVHAFTTQQDINLAANFNLASHVNDDMNTVLANRADVSKHFHFSHDPAWLNQTHSRDCIDIDRSSGRDADAAITRRFKQPLVILTADCLPILLCHQSKPVIAAIHAGWRGLHAGVIENTLADLDDDPSQYIAWIGPAICGNCYQVGRDLYEKFIQKYPASERCFRPQDDKYYFDLSRMAEHVFMLQGVSKVFQSQICTFENPLLYSYRRQAHTGRIATFIWLEDNIHDY